MSAKPNPIDLPRALAEGIDTLNAATLNGDFDSARLCLSHLREMATGEGLRPLGAALAGLSVVLGKQGRPPGPGLGNALVGVTEALEGIPQR